MNLLCCSLPPLLRLADCDFTISLVQHKLPVTPATDKKGRGNKSGSGSQPVAAAKAANAKKAAESQLQQQQQASTSQFSPRPACSSSTQYSGWTWYCLVLHVKHCDTRYLPGVAG